MQAHARLLPPCASLRWPFFSGALLLLSFTGCDKPAHPVAQVGKVWIGQPQWKLYQERHAAGSTTAGLDHLVRREVAWQQAEQRGLVKGGEWEEFSQRNRTTVLSKAYLNRQPGPPPVTEAMAKAHFLASSEQRHIVHLVCKTREQASAAHLRIKQGEAFEKVATAVSIDPTVAKNHGDIGWIKREQVVQPFADPVFSAKAGDLCGPFQTEFGWHLAQVREIQVPTDADYGKNKASILAGLEEMNENQRRPEALKPLRAEYPLNMDKAVLGLDRTTVAAPGDEGRIAGSVGSMNISLKDLKQFMTEYMNVSGQSHGLGVETKGKFLDIMADDLRLRLAAEKAKLAKLPDVQAALWDSEREAAFLAFAKTYLASYKVPEADLNGHYDANKDRFRGVGAVKVYLLVANQPEAIDKAAHESMKGTSWSRLVEKYANKESTGQWDAGWLEISSLEKVLPKQAITALQKKPEGTLIGPISSPEGVMLFKLLERRPGDVMPLKDCLEAVQQDYLKEHGAALMDKYLDTEGRSVLSVKTFPENLSIKKDS